MTYGIAFGSNLGDRLENLRQGLSELLSRSGGRLLAASKVYETEPVACPEGSASYLNTVIELEAIQSPHELHHILQRVESLLGRPAQRDLNAPRQLDLDILYAGGLTINDEQLIIPHPRMQMRRFVLQPLSDISPELVLPGQAENIRSLLESLDDDPLSVSAIADARWAVLT